VHIILLLVIAAAVLIGPTLWVRWIMQRHAAPRDDFPGTAGELARHLLHRLGLDGVSVEETEAGDHYDPEARAVRLTPEHLRGRSLTAVVIAAHEVGHAIQHHSGYEPLALRSRLAGLALGAERAGALLMMALPVMAGATRSPAVGLLTLTAGVLSLGTSALVHLVTLPVELDASFRRALPLLTAGRYIGAADAPAARRILMAAALTYVAASLLSLLNVWRWLRLLRR
jgi:Zn-dependent membrane protease YugP